MKKLAMFLILTIGVMSYADPLLHLTLDGNLTDTGTAGITGITMGANGGYSTSVPPNGATESYLSNTSSDADQTAKIIIPTSAALTPASGSFTMTFWLYAEKNGWGNLGMGIYDKLDSAAGKGILVSSSSLDTTSAKLFVQVNGWQGNTVGSGITYVGKWMFVALTFDGTKNLTTYQGTEDEYLGLIGAAQLANNAGAVQSNDKDAVLGYRESYGGRALDGSLSDFRLYDGVLDATAIEAVYNEMIPEPVTVGMLLIGGVGLVMGKKRV